MFPNFSFAMGGAGPSMRDWEDAVQKLVDESDQDALALLYKALYARGYRISSVDGQIAKLKKKCGP